MNIEHVIAQVASRYVQFGKNHKLTPEGGEAVIKLAIDVLQEKKFPLSDRIDVLSGFGIKSLGFDILCGEARRSPILICANHYNGPGMIIANAIAVAHCFKQELGIEPEVVFGKGFSFISSFRNKANRSTNVILVGGKEKGSIIINNKLDAGSSVVLYPEGKTSVELRVGSYKSGRIVVGAAKKGVSILPVGVYFDARTQSYVVRAGAYMNNEQILKLGDKEEEEKVRSGQAVIDYVMTHVAATLPENLRGRYCNIV